MLTMQLLLRCIISSLIAVAICHAQADADGFDLSDLPAKGSLSLDVQIEWGGPTTAHEATAASSPEVTTSQIGPISAGVESTSSSSTTYCDTSAAASVFWSGPGWPEDSLIDGDPTSPSPATSSLLPTAEPLQTGNPASAPWTWSVSPSASSGFGFVSQTNNSGSYMASGRMPSSTYAAPSQIPYSSGSEGLCLARRHQLPSFCVALAFAHGWTW